MPELPEPQTTPVKHTNSRAATFASSTLDPNALQYHIDVAEDMRLEFVGPMPVDEFLKEFVPLHVEPTPQVGNTLAKAGSSEKDFINAITTHGLCPSLEFVDTTDKGDKKHPKYAKPDMSVFNRRDIVAAGITKTSLDDTKQPSDVCPSPQIPPPPTPKKKGSRKAAHDFRMCFPILEMPIERKPDGADQDPFTDGTSTEAGEETPAFQNNAVKGKRNRGQMIKYTTAQFSAQFRAFSFSIVLFPDAYRLVRWDRAGAVVTKRTSLESDGQYLAEFLWRFDHLTPQQRGWDTTVCVPTKAEADLAKSFLESEAVREYLVDINGETDVTFTTLHKFHVRDEKTKKDHCFVGPHARWYTYAPTGRCTFGYIAVDLETHNLVYLKDTWRADVPDIKPEGVTYRLLHEHGVPYIAGLVCSGDVGDQKTRTQEFTTKSWAIGKMRIIPHVHYRIVLDTIGRPLKSSKSSRELCTSVQHAVESHWIAYNKAGVLHRDISGGNILIRKSKTGEGYEGLLIDWELCKSVKLKTPRRDWRTGTWQFIAAEILIAPGTPHELRHDLESFFHVLLYHILRYCRHSLPTLELEASMQKVFDSCTWSKQLETVIGGEEKRTIFLDGIFSAEVISNQFNPSLVNIIEDLRSQFSHVYRTKASRAYDAAAAAASFTFLSGSEGAIAVFEEHLKEPDWPLDDGGRDNLAGNTAKRSQDHMSESASYNRNKRVRSLQQSSGNSQQPSTLSFLASLPGVAEE